MAANRKPAATLWGRITLSSYPIGPLFEKDVLLLVGRIVKNNDTAFLRQLADSAVTNEELIRIELIRARAYKLGRRTIQVHEREPAFTGNDSILPVHEENLFVGKHVIGKLWEKGKGERNYTPAPSVSVFLEIT
jgi:hypothetical protein